MKGTYLKGDLDFTNAYAENVNYIYNKDLKINSDSLKKNLDNLYFNKSFITPCDLNGIFGCPTWTLKVRKTKYIISKDQFRHFNAFLSIADKKIAYLPYFSHYGTKAGRKMGFLTPTFQPININNGSNLTTPFYIPIQEHTEITFKPTFYYERYLTDYFKSTTKINNKNSRGSTNMTIDNFYDNKAIGVVSKGYTVNTTSNLTLNKNNKLYLNSVYTSNVSEYKSSDNTKAATLNSNLSLETYNIISDKDLLI